MHFFPVIKSEEPTSTSANNVVKNSYAEALDKTFLAMDTYFDPSGEHLLLNTTIKQYNDTNDLKSIDNIIKFLEETNNTISYQIIEFGADPRYGKMTQNQLFGLIQMCNVIKEKVTNGEIDSSKIYKRYNQKKHEMNLLKEFQLKAYYQDKSYSNTKIRESLAKLKTITESDLKMPIKCGNTTDCKFALSKNLSLELELVFLRKSIDDYHYKYDNQNLADDMITIIEKLEMIIEHQNNETAIDQVIFVFDFQYKKNNNPF